MNQLDSDLKAARIYQQKQSSYESAVYWRELDWRREQYQFYEVNAMNFSEEYVVLQNIEAPIHDILRKFTALKKGIATQLPKTPAKFGPTMPPNSDDTNKL
jgi:carboxylesterase type B